MLNKILIFSMLMVISLTSFDVFSVENTNFLVNNNQSGEKKENTSKKSSIKYASLELNGGSYLVGFGPSIDLDWNFGGTIGFLNGLAIRGKIVFHSKTPIINSLLDLSGVDVGGTAGTIGLRYFFGKTGLNGFFIGANALFGKLKLSTSGSSASGNIEYNYSGFTIDLGVRWILFNYLTLGIGIEAGYMSGTGTGTVTTSNGKSITISTIQKFPWLGSIISLGVAF